MKQILLILVFAVSFLGAAELVSVDSNNTVQTVITHLAEDVSIANNATWNSFIYDSIEFLKVNIYSALFVIFVYIGLFWFLPILRSILLIVLFNVVYLSIKTNISFPIIDIIYYGYFIWLLGELHKYLLDKDIISESHTRIDLIFNILEILISILVLYTILNSYEGLSIYIKALASFGIAGFAFIARGYFKSLLSFMYNSALRRISEKDIIEVDDFEGIVTNVSKFSIELQVEKDGKKGKSYIPNHILTDKGFTNWGKGSTYIKFSFKAIAFNNKSDIDNFIDELEKKLIECDSIHSKNYIKEVNIDEIQIGFYPVDKTDKDQIKKLIIRIIRGLAKTNYIRLES